MVEVTVLGIAQDGGRPQAGCYKSCCLSLTSEDIRYPVALGIIDNDGATHLIEASRHLGEQLRFVWKLSERHEDKNKGIDNLWITHAHLGHIDGLGLFGRETMNAAGIQLHVSESLANLIHRTPSWDLMLQQGVFNIDIFKADNIRRAITSSTLTIEHLPIPHRAELSDMHGFIIRGPNKSLLFLPDHDTWEQTLCAHSCKTIRQFLQKLHVDFALVDGTFWSFHELGNLRDQAQVPHPPVSETIHFLGARRPEDPQIFFTHLNHTNPLYDTNSAQYQTLNSMGWEVASQGMKFHL